MISTNLLRELRRRAAGGCPVGVGIVGTGFLGRGLLNRIPAIPGMRTVAVAGRRPDRVRAVLEDLGVRGVTVCAGALDVPSVGGVDIVVDAVGDPVLGAELAVECAARGRHFVAAPETDATVGPLLAHRARQAGTVYTGAEGDEPGVTMGLYNYVTLLGLEIVAAGKFKGFLDPEATPASVEPWARRHGQNPAMLTSFADGTKMALEMALVANATGLVPDIRGMHLPEATLETVARVLSRREEGGILSRRGVVEVVRGAEPAAACFVVATTSDDHLKADLDYMKLGPGPNYLLYRPFHLCAVEMPLGLARAVLAGEATIAPAGRPVADVPARAKTDLPAGTRLDGIGGYHLSGLLEYAETVVREQLLPIGAAGGAVLRRAVRKGQVLTYDDVEFTSETTLLSLRRLQEAWPVKPP